MLAVYCAESTTRSTVFAALPVAEPWRLANDWRALDEVSSDASCTIVAARWLAPDDAGDALADLKTSRPCLPVVLVTTQDAENLRRVCRVVIEEVVWLHEVRTALSPAVDRAKTSGALLSFASGVAASAALPALLRHALLVACRRRLPVHSLADLAAVIGRDRRTLWRYWRDAWRTTPPFRLEDLLDWIVLLHASARKSSGSSWTAVATELGVHEHTLARVASRLLGWTLRETAVAPRGTLEAEFTTRVGQRFADAARSSRVVARWHPNPARRSQGRSV